MPTAGEVYDTGTVRLEFLRTAAETDGALHEMRATYAAGSPVPPAHLHPDQDERFELLDGALTFVVDGAERTVAAGDTIEVARGAVHQVHNAGEVAAVAVWQTRPALRTGEFLQAVHAAASAEDWDGLQAALREYRDVFRMVPDPFARSEPQRGERTP